MDQRDGYVRALTRAALTAPQLAEPPLGPGALSTPGGRASNKSSACFCCDSLRSASAGEISSNSILVAPISSLPLGAGALPEAGISGFGGPRACLIDGGMALSKPRSVGREPTTASPLHPAEPALSGSWPCRAGACLGVASRALGPPPAPCANIDGPSVIKGTAWLPRLRPPAPTGILGVSWPGPAPVARAARFLARASISPPGALALPVAGSISALPVKVF